MSNIRYNIYPTLLDAFQIYLDADARAEEWWNIDEVGNYRHTPQELAECAEQELIDTINRCREFDTTLADRGTLFNNIVDEMIKEEYAGSDTVEQRTLNGHTFNFDVKMAKGIANMMPGAEFQQPVSATIETRHGDVNLCGYVDYWWRDTVIDLKTTSRYDFGKYANHWQRYLYPYCLCKNGCDVSWFQFVVVLMKEKKSTGVIEGEIYTEFYNHYQAIAESKLRNICELFIEWLDGKRELITNKKIFNEHELLRTN